MPAALPPGVAGRADGSETQVFRMSAGNVVAVSRERRRSAWGSPSISYPIRGLFIPSMRRRGDGG